MASSSPYGKPILFDVMKMLEELENDAFMNGGVAAAMMPPSGVKSRGPMTFTMYWTPHPEPMVKFQEYDVPDQPIKKIIASMDITQLQLAVARSDVIRDAVKKVTAHLEVEVAKLIQSADLAAMAQQILKEELRKAIAGRIDEFVEEMLEDA